MTMSSTIHGEGEQIPFQWSSYSDLWTVIVEGTPGWVIEPSSPLLDSPVDYSNSRHFRSGWYIDYPSSTRLSFASRFPRWERKDTACRSLRSSIEICLPEWFLFVDDNRDFDREIVRRFPEGCNTFQCYDVENHWVEFSNNWSRRSWERRWTWPVHRWNEQFWSSIRCRSDLFVVCAREIRFSIIERVHCRSRTSPETRWRSDGNRTAEDEDRYVGQCTALWSNAFDSVSYSDWLRNHGQPERIEQWNDASRFIPAYFVDHFTIDTGRQLSHEDIHHQFDVICSNFFFDAVWEESTRSSQRERERRKNRNYLRYRRAQCLLLRLRQHWLLRVPLSRFLVPSEQDRVYQSLKSSEPIRALFQVNDLHGTHLRVSREQQQPPLQVVHEKHNQAERVSNRVYLRRTVSFHCPPTWYCHRDPTRGTINSDQLESISFSEHSRLPIGQEGRNRYPFDHCLSSRLLEVIGRRWTSHNG